MKKIIAFILLALLTGCQRQIVPVKYGAVVPVNTSTPNSGAGDDLYTDFNKINASFTTVLDSQAIRPTITQTNANARKIVHDSLLAALNAAADIPTYVTQRLADFAGSGSSVKATKIQFVVGQTGWPANGDSILTNTNLIGKDVDLWRGTTADLHKEWYNSATVNERTGYRFASSTGMVVVRPTFSTGDRVYIDALDAVNVTWINYGSGSSGGSSDLLTGLTSYWKMDETSGTTFNDAVGTNNGTLSGATPNGTGKLGKCLSFANTTDYGLVPNNSSLYPTSDHITVRLWFKLNSLPSSGSNYFYLVDFNDGTTYYTFESHISNSGNYIAFYLKNTSGTGCEAETNTNLLSINTWYHLVLVLNGAGTTPIIYLNASDITFYTTGNFTGTLKQPDGDLMIGNSTNSNTKAIMGYIDEVAYYKNTAWTQGEVTEDYNSGTGKTHPFN